MPDLPHSKTVRGTLGNPKSQEAIKNNDKPQSMLGDPVSLKAETTDSESVEGRQRQDGGTVDIGSSSGDSDRKKNAGDASADSIGKEEKEEKIKSKL
jgi:hypothetical protein